MDWWFQAPFLALTGRISEGGAGWSNPMVEEFVTQVACTPTSQARCTGSRSYEEGAGKGQMAGVHRAGEGRLADILFLGAKG
jgi:hypothetical protein